MATTPGFPCWPKARPTPAASGSMCGTTSRSAGLSHRGRCSITRAIGPVRIRLGMLTGPIARVIEHRPRWLRPAERLVVPHIDPDAAGVGLAFGQHGNPGVVAMQSLGAQHVGL